MDAIGENKSQIGSAAFKCVFAAIMLGIGAAHKAECPNGAANFLFIAGIIILCINLMGVLSIFAKQWAEADGKVTAAESCGLCIISTISTLLLLADLIVLIWGSIVVFGRYGVWTSDKPKVGDLPDNYCGHTPEMTAFVFLILYWIAIPFICMCTCFSLMCKLFCKSS